MTYSSVLTSEIYPSLPKAEGDNSSIPKTEESNSAAPKTDEIDSSIPKTEETDSSTPKTKEVEANSSVPKAEEADSSNPKAKKADPSNPKAEEANSSNPKAEEADSSNPKAEEADSSNPKAEEADSSNPKPEEADSSNPKTEEADSSNPKAEEADSSDPKPEEADSSVPKTEDVTSSKTEEVDSSPNHAEEEVDTLGDTPVNHVEHDADAAGQPVRGFVDYETYEVQNTIVRRGKHVVYNRDSGVRLHENLVNRHDIRYQGFTWELRFSWVNETSSPNTYIRTIQEGLTVRDGHETEANFGVSASFKGLSVGGGGSIKHFSETETSRLEEVRKEVTVEPQSITYFYQKRYNFLSEVWFWQRVPSWQNHNHFGVGRLGGGARVLRTATTFIYAEEYATLLRRLTGSTRISADSVPGLPDDPPVNRQFQNITQRGKDTLAGWDIRG